jgi:hypothetical protein
VGEEIWDSYYKFCIERNPFDKAVSLYHWKGRKGGNLSISEFLATTPRSLSNAYLYMIDGKPALDRIVRFERLNDELEEVRQHIGLPEPLDLPHLKSGYRPKKSHYRDVLSAEDRALVERVCAAEIELLGYEFDAAPDSKTSEAEAGS